MTVTGLKQTSQERITVSFDDGSELKTTLSVVTGFYLCTGMELDDDRYRELLSASSLSLCKARALRIVGARPVSRKELRDKLTEKGESPENAEQCADWLCELGMIDDAVYAEMLVSHYSAKGYGVGRIRQELNRHGVPRELWDDALEQMPEQDDKLIRFIASRLTDPNDRAITGLSSSGIAAFTAAWFHPDFYSKVYSIVGTFVPMRGGDTYPGLIRKYEPKNIRIYMQCRYGLRSS